MLSKHTKLIFMSKLALIKPFRLGQNLSIQFAGVEKLCAQLVVFLEV